MNSTFNNIADYERNLCILKSKLQNRAEEEKQCSFKGGSKIVAAYNHPRNVRYALECDVAADFLLYGQYVKARSVEFWIYLASVAGTITIIDPVSGNDINQNAGTLSYADWDNAFVNAVDTDTIGTGWSHVIIISSTDVELASGFNLGKGAILVNGMRWWNYELDSTEISQLYAGTVGFYGESLVALWDLPNLTDLSGSGNDATLPGGGADPTVVASGRNQENCFRFDGGNDYVDCGDDSSLSITDAITVEAWIYWKEYTVNSVILSKFSQTYILGYQPSDDGKLHWQVYTNAWVNISVSVTKNEWHYFVGTYDKNLGSNQMKVYLDGEFIDDATQTGSIDTQVGNLGIGIYYIGKPAPFYFNGLIDTVRILNRALTRMEISERYIKTRRGLL